MASLALYRCMNPKCRKKDKGNFTVMLPAESVTCPQCAITIRPNDKNDNKYGRFIVRRASVHFDPPTEVPGVGQNHRACNTAKPIQADSDMLGNINPYHAGTGNPKAVTCPACKETKVFKDVLASVMTEDDDKATLTSAAMERLEPLKKITRD